MVDIIQNSVIGIDYIYFVRVKIFIAIIYVIVVLIPAGGKSYHIWRNII